MEAVGLMRVVVTGASGLIGRHAVASLAAAGHEVHAVARTAPDDDATDVVWHAVDLLDDDARRTLVADVAATHVLHAAWHADPADYRHSPKNLDWAIATTNLVRETAEAGAERFVGVGTCFEYDLAAGWCRETHTTMASDTVYGRAKHLTQQLVTEAAAAHDITAAWGRVFFTFGPGENPRRVIAHVISQVLAGDAADCSDGQQLRDFLPAAQVGDALAALTTSNVEGPVNICSGRPVLLADLLTEAATLAGGRDRLHLGARESSPGEPPLIAGDVSRLRDEVGWLPTRSTSDELAATVAWWREQTHG